MMKFTSGVLETVTKKMFSLNLSVRIPCENDADRSSKETQQTILHKEQNI